LKETRLHKESFDMTQSDQISQGETFILKKQGQNVRLPRSLFDKTKNSKKTFKNRTKNV